MTNKIERARVNLIKSTKELDDISKCYHAREKSCN